MLSLFGDLRSHRPHDAAKKKRLENRTFKIMCFKVLRRASLAAQR